MVASRAEMLETPEIVVREMSAHMETLAADGDWAEVESLAVRLRSAVMNVAEEERLPLLHLAQLCTERVTAAAECARQEVSGRIAGIRRGQKATRAYASG